MWAFLIGGFLRVSYKPHDWPNFYVCVTVGRSDMSIKIHRRELAGIFYSNRKISSNFRAVFWAKKRFEIIPSRPKFASEFAGWFPSVFQSLQMYYCVFCNLADSSRVKTNEEIITLFTIKTKNYTHVAIQVQAFRWKPKTLRLFSRNEEA